LPVSVPAPVQATLLAEVLEAGIDGGAAGNGFTVRLAAPVDPDVLTRAGVARAEASPGYWAHLWPSARELARHLVRSSLVAPGVRVLEIGCGLGLCGIVAAKRGATVMMTDFNPDAVATARRNAELNDVDVRCEVFDWNGPVPVEWIGNTDLVIASDVLYELRAAEAVGRLIAALGCPAIIADPARPQSADAEGVFQAMGLRAWATPANSGRMMMVTG
jgi:predicted nicotinamide N-methyase